MSPAADGPREPATPRSDGGGLPDLVVFDGRLVPRAAARVSAFDRSVLYGESLFETVKVVDGAPCLWPLHRERLLRGCDELGFPLQAAELERGIAELLAARPVSYGALRVQVTGGEQPSGGRGLTAPATGRSPRVIASVTPLVLPAPRMRVDGVSVVVAHDLCRPLPCLKTGSYLTSVVAKGRAEAAGAFECLLAGGEPPQLFEGAFTNVLLAGEGVLATPPRTHRLPGVTLGVVLDEAGRLGVKVVERPVFVAETPGRALLLTSSLLGVCVCSSVDGVTVEADLLRRTASLAEHLQEALETRERRSRERGSWLGQTSMT